MPTKKMSKKTTTSKAQSKKTASPRLVDVRQSPIDPLPLTQFIGSGLKNTIASLFGSPTSHIVEAIRKDHDDLKEWIKILRDGSKEMKERKRAYEKFSALLKSHSVAEETAVYAFCEKVPKRELNIETAEGFAEHAIADDLMAKIAGLREPKEWTAHTKVLAELVEHHIVEEEEELLPNLKKVLTAEQNTRLLEEFLTLRAASEDKRHNHAGVLTEMSV